MSEAELDPEIAALLAGTSSGSGTSSTESTLSIEDIDRMPSASDSFDVNLTEGHSQSHVPASGSVHEVNLSLKEFAPLEKIKNEESSGI